MRQEQDTTVAEQTVPEPMRRRTRPSMPAMRAVSASGIEAAGSVSTRDGDAAAFSLTLRQAEILRTRRFVPFVVALALAGALLAPFADGDAFAMIVVYVGITCGLVGMGFLFWLAGDVDRFRDRHVALAYSGVMTAVFSGVYYWGIFSPAAAIVAFGLFFVALGNARIGLALYILSALCQGGLAIAVLGGALRDRGLITADHSGLGHQIVQQLMLQVVYAVTYVIARMTRVQLDRAVGDHDAAVRAVAQRDALLVEARQDLDQALKVGDAGRYSDQIVGSFRLGMVIGRGAMGDVYDAVHIEDGTPAAVKLLKTGAPGASLARFYREAAAVSKLRSEHIVQLYEVSAAGDVLPYLAMERLRGRDLATILRERRRLQIDDASDLVRQIALGLEEARAVGIVHRDIKPQNLFLTAEGTWKILDFGVSKLSDTQGTLTRDHIIGTPVYMAPEQARGLPVDHRADCCALATVVYRAITGQPPYAGRDVPSILYSVVHTVPKRPSSLAKLPNDVDHVLAIGLAKDPGDRFANASDFAAAWRLALGNKLSGNLREHAEALVAAYPWS
jgi:eukaryotic-like serine/threonine-protein kinase